MIWKSELSWILLWLSCIGAASAASASNQLKKDGNNTKIDCTAPYVPVGNQCLLIDNTLQGTWEKMTEYCSAYGGYLLEVHDANILYYLSNYLKDNGLDDVTYWTGANDQEKEFDWVYASDKSEVEYGTPRWGYYGFFQDPFGGRELNCGVILQGDFYYMHDLSCFNLYSPICQDANTRAREENYFKLKNTANATVNECPDPFSSVADTCFYVDADCELGWDEAQNLCEDLGGHLAKIDDANLFADLVKFMAISVGTQNKLWLGGTNNNFEDVWMWYDGSMMNMGTPYWAPIGDDKQAPFGGSENCLMIWQSDFYYFVDEGCSLWHGAVCQYDI